MENYVKQKGTVTRHFSTDPPITLKPYRFEHQQGFDYTSLFYESPDLWVMYYEIINSSETSYQICSPPQLDYLIDGDWYECSSYGGASNRYTESISVLGIPAQKRVSYTLPIGTPISRNRELPYYSGRFWYGHYRLVIEFAKGEFTYVEFDIPKSANYFSEPLYKNIP